MKNLSVLFAVLMFLATPILAQESVWAPPKKPVGDSSVIIIESQSSRSGFDREFDLQANRLKFDALALGYPEAAIDMNLVELKKMLKVISSTSKRK